MTTKILLLLTLFVPQQTEQQKQSIDQIARYLAKSKAKISFDEPLATTQIQFTTLTSSIFEITTSISIKSGKLDVRHWASMGPDWWGQREIQGETLIINCDGVAQSEPNPEHRVSLGNIPKSKKVFATFIGRGPHGETKKRHTVVLSKKEISKITDLTEWQANLQTLYPLEQPSRKQPKPISVNWLNEVQKYSKTTVEPIEQPTPDKETKPDKKARCEPCSGRGSFRCDRCRGTGAIKQTRTINGKKRLAKTECSGCKGSGRTKCNSCAK